MPNPGRTSRFRRLRTTLARWGRILRDGFPLTWLGVLVAVGGALCVFHYGIKRIDLVLLVVGALAVAVVVLELLFVAITAITLRLALRKVPAGDPLHLECGYPSSTGFAIPRFRFMPFVKLTWSWTTPSATVHARPRNKRLEEEITPRARGICEAVTRRFEIRDVFGFAKVAFERTEPRAVRIAPSTGALRSMHVVRSIAGGDDMPHPEGPAQGERIDMRHYAPGDPIKYVLWKVYARTRQLVVRTPERALSPIKQTVAYLVAGNGDEPAAGAARVAVDTGALGTEWVLGADGVYEYVKSAPEAVDLLARSAGADASEQGAGLAKFLSTATPGNIGRAVVFVPGRPGPWLERVAAAARARAGKGLSPVEFVVCTDGVDRRAKPSVLRRIAFEPVQPETESSHDAHTGPPSRAEDVAKVVDSLMAARAKVLLVDRVAGRVYLDGKVGR